MSHMWYKMSSQLTDNEAQDEVLLINIINDKMLPYFPICFFILCKIISKTVNRGMQDIVETNEFKFSNVFLEKTYIIF